jgi:DNA-binding NtrC family response regulator
MKTALAAPRTIAKENDMDRILEQNMDLLVRYYLAINYPQPRIALKELVRALEKHAIRETLQLTRGRQKRAAELLGVMETTFCEKVKRYGIRDEMHAL